MSAARDTRPAFYHTSHGLPILGWTNMVIVNQGLQETLEHEVCPFLLREVGHHGAAILNFGFYATLRIFSTDRPITQDWPVKSGIHWGTTNGAGPNVVEAGNAKLDQWLQENAKDVTAECFRDASLMIESGSYRETQKRASEEAKGRESFMICPIGNSEVDHNYEFVIKPAVEKFQFRILRAEEIPHTGLITGVIEQQIRRSRFVVADLTDERQNCYYEVGLARAWGKPTILLAKVGTTRHFDISGIKWTMWQDYTDLKPKLEQELIGVLQRLGT